LIGQGIGSVKLMDNGVKIILIYGKTI